MNNIQSYMTQGHGDCDGLFAIAEQSAADGKLESARGHFHDFQLACEHHFHREETVLFPLIERFTGNAGGPTRVMRMEHQQIRGLLGQLTGLLEDGSGEEFLGGAETLLVLMQQHNMKEEQILYPMADQVLAQDVTSVIAAMDKA